MMSQSKLFRNYILALGIGIFIGFKILPVFVMIILYLVLAGIVFNYALKGDIENFFSYLPYIIFSEIFIRGHVRLLPYLSAQYLIIISFLLFLIRGRFNVKDLHFRPIVFFILFYLLEILNGFYSFTPRITGALQWQTFTVLVVVVWASFNKLSPSMINKIMDNSRIATIFLVGVVLVAHLQGKIDYGNASNSDASNNMAPVQLSGYLGTGAFLIMASILNTFDKRSKIIHSLFLVLTITLMVLTFSRGGVYFVGILTIIYMFFNRANLGNYFKFLIFIPIGLIIYNFVLVQTGGRVVDRYNAKGASNREELVAIGIQIFTENPLIGIGTGNYNNYIKRNHLFTVESGVHNEFVRVAAEHGVFGICLYWGFFISLLVTILFRSRPSKDFALYFFVLFVLITIHNGLKISIQPFVLLLAVAIAPQDYIPVRKKKLINA